MSLWETKFARKGLTFDSVFLIPVESHVLPNEIKLDTKLAPNLQLHIPPISAGMDIVTEGDMAVAIAENGGLDVIHKNLSVGARAEEVKRARTKAVDSNLSHPAVDTRGHLLAVTAVGITNDIFERVETLLKAGADAIVVGTAYGHSIGVLCKIREIRDHFPEVILVVGNVATGERTAISFDVGVDVVKVGIGSGSICTTHIATGVGIPRITTIYGAASVAQKYGKRIVANGGIKYSGNVVKALVTRGNATMLGSMFSGTTETPGAIFINEGRKFRPYRGMGSVGAIFQQHGPSNRCLQGGVNEANKLIPESAETLVPYRGDVSNIIYQISGGLHTGTDYAGTGIIEELIGNSQSVQITNAGLCESHPHDVQMAKEIPNYGGSGL